MFLNGVIVDGDCIVIEWVVLVNIMVDGDIKILYIIDLLVEDVIQKFGIEVVSEDKVYFVFVILIKVDMKICVVCVIKCIVEVEQLIVYKVIKMVDLSLYKGDNCVIVNGKEGIFVQYIEKVFQDGELVFKKMVVKLVLINCVDKVIVVGIKVKFVVKQLEIQMVLV